MIVSRAAGRCAATRQRIAVAALAGSAPATRLARQYGTSRKFIGVVREKARRAVQQAFVAQPEMSSELEAFARVSQAWVRRFAPAIVLARLAKGSASRRAALEIEMAQAQRDGDGRRLSLALGRAGRAETQTRELARDVKTLVGWLGHDLLSLAGPELHEGREMFDFVVEQLRLALARQRDAVLGFAGVLDDKLAALAQR